MSQTIDSTPKAQPMDSWGGHAIRWLLLFEQAVSSASADTLRDLFHEDCHLRDLLAVTWQVKTVSGLRNILGLIQSLTPETLKRSNIIYFKVLRTPSDRFRTTLIERNCQDSQPVPG